MLEDNIEKEAPNGGQNMTESPATETDGRAEDSARQWWTRHLGCPIPQDIENWIRQLTRTEARRLLLQSNLMSEKQTLRATEALNLSSARMRHIREEMRRVSRQQEWLHNFQCLQQARQQHADALYEANKRLATIGNDEKRLERFETFEPIQGSYLHLHLLTRMGGQQRAEQAELQNDLQAEKETFEEEKKNVERKRLLYAEADNRLSQANEHVEQMFRVLGERTVLDIALRNASLRAEQLAQQHDIRVRTTAELKAQEKQIEEELGRLKTQQQSLEAHRNMLEHGQEMVLRLKMLLACQKEIKDTGDQLEKVRRKLREENKSMGQLYEEYQRIEGDINELSSELYQHRQSIANATTYQLQERAMREKTRYQILLGAQVTWQHICNGYRQLERLREELTQLEHKVQYGQQNVETLTREINRLQVETKEKEYTLIVSKSQSVIQLRSDLKEGISCTVCGAAHHPYHSDTMLEQNMLIEDIRSEYNQLNQVYLGSVRRLEEEQKELTANQASLRQKQEFLDYVKQHQDNLVQQWQMYASLDSSFADCSPGTNQTARTEMIRLLIENSLKQSQDAQQELDMRNFHQAEINKLTEQLAKKEQEKENLLTRLNEVNTGCHVLTRHEELLEDVRNGAQKRYSTHYEEAVKTITLHEWMTQLGENPEQLMQRITSMMQQLADLRRQIETLEARKARTLALIQNVEEECNFLDRAQQINQSETERLSVLLQEGQKRYDQLMNLYGEENFHKTNHQAVKDAHVQLEKALDAENIAATKYAHTEGMVQELTQNAKDVERQMTQLRYRLDLWISRYNANHPPVQYEELESSLDSTTDWEKIRKDIRSTRIEAGVRDMMLKYLESEIAEMQTIASKDSANIYDLNEHSLEEEMKRLSEDLYQEALSAAQYRLMIEQDAQTRQTLQQESQALQDLADK